MEEEDSDFIERLDSLWFFSNLLSLRNQSMASGAADEKSTQFSLNQPEVTEPLSPIAQIQKNQNGNPDIPVQLQRCPDCGAETETHMAAKTELLKVLPPLEHEKRRRSKRSFKSCLNQRRRTVWESDVQLNMGFSVNWVVEEASGYQWFGSPNHVKIPPLTLTDGTAMKQNLKSWAYAVACTVR